VRVETVVVVEAVVAVGAVIAILAAVEEVGSCSAARCVAVYLTVVCLGPYLRTSRNCCVIWRASV
jgi:hypothetical protein